MLPPWLKQYRLLFLLLLLIALTACKTTNTNSRWPSDLPDRQIFVECYMKKSGMAEVGQQALEAHLIWIKRFYQGTILYRNGWNNASTMFLDTVDSEIVKAELKLRMRELGIAISCEWAQDNESRNIDSSNIAVWGSAMSTAASINDHEVFVSKVERDVAKLISGALQRSEIEYERYYPEEDYDNF